jgi:hypothetical protein
MTDRSMQIAVLNDLFRKSFGTMVPGIWTFTDGLAALGANAVAEASVKVARFRDFTTDNDPYGEHDFGTISVLGRKVFWKIDYFSDDRMIFGTRDAADQNRSFRVLTIMLAEEW